MEPGSQAACNQAFSPKASNIFANETEVPGEIDEESDYPKERTMSPNLAKVEHYEILIGFHKSTEIAKKSIQHHLTVKQGKDHF
jgi:hypothetical protein